MSPSGVLTMHITVYHCTALQPATSAVSNAQACAWTNILCSDLELVGGSTRDVEPFVDAGVDGRRRLVLALWDVK